MAVGTGISLAETKRLGNDLLISRSNINNAPFLLSILSSSGAESCAIDREPSATYTQCRLEALRSLQAFFIPLLRSGKFISAAKQKGKLDIEVGGAADESEKDKEGEASRHAEAVYRLWVWNKYRQFTKSLSRIVAQHTNAQVLQVAAVNALMDLIREERRGEFSNSLYLKMCARMLNSKGESNEILQVLLMKYFKYSDVRYFTYANVERLVVKRLGKKERDLDSISSDEDNDHERIGASLHTFIRNAYDALSHLPPPKGESKDEESTDELWSYSHDGEVNEKNLTGKEGGKKVKGKLSAPNDNLRKRKNLKKQKFIMSKAWVSFLQLPLPVDTYKQVLAKLHKEVIPYMTNPILLSDFLTQSYNIGGLISVMALSSLFILITKHGLEYPEFYNKLYALLEPSIFVAKYRARFFEWPDLLDRSYMYPWVVWYLLQLLDTCLKSSHLPGYLGAAFAKRLGRLVLSAPPSGAIVVIALIHNLLRRHPSINVLVHQPDSNHTQTALKAVHGRESREGDAENNILSLEGDPAKTHERIPEGRLGADPFVATEVDPAKSNALNSSLWEIETLRRHYCPAVSRFVESLENDLTVRAKTTEVNISDFSSTSYATIFGEEVGRRLKSVPLAFYSSLPTTLFPESNLEGSLDGWRFKVSPGHDLQSLEGSKGTELEDTGKLEESNELVEEDENEESEEDVHSEELSSDGSRGSRSRSEQSEGEGWPQPLLKRIRNL